jgi:Zn-dependent metalloprotease
MNGKKEGKSMLRKFWNPVAITALIALLCLFALQGFSADLQIGENASRMGKPHSEKVRFHSNYNTAEVVSGQFIAPYGTTKKEKAYSFIASRPETFRIYNPAEELELIVEKTDEQGLTHLRFQQKYKGLPVWGAQTIVHFSDNEIIYLVGGQTIATPDLNTIPAITLEEANTAALLIVKNMATGSNLETQSELVVYQINNEAKLVRLVTVTSPSDGSIRWRVFVDAQTGDVVDKFNDIHFDGPDVGSGIDVLGSNQTFNIYLESGDYKMKDFTRNGAVITYEDYYNGGPVSTDPDGDKIWDDNTDQRAAVSGHVYAALTYDYFFNTHGRDSYDGFGSDVIVNVHDPRYTNNAYWNGQAINFADGDGTNYLPFSGSLDVVAHELGHGVTEYTAGLIYRFQSGALNESYSDVWGACVDRDDWLLGDDIRLSAPGFIRSMEDPTLRGHPAHMDDYGWLPIESDNGGVHSNSGIPNHAFYWASSLESRDVAELVWYRALTTYLTPSSGMYFWAAMIMQSVDDLYGDAGTEFANIQLSLSQVGFNATYAVPEELDMSNIVGTISYDTIWIQNPTSNTVSVSSTVPPGLAGLGVSAPASIPANDSGAVEVSFDTQALDSCDVGLYSDRLEITTDGAPFSSIIYIPIDIYVGYTSTTIQNVSVNTSCLEFDGRNTSGIDDFRKGGNDAAYDGSLLIGIKDGSNKTAYRDVFGTLSLIPVDTVSTDTVGKSFRISSSDGRIQGSVQYRWYDGADPDTCDFIIADYYFENICETTLTVYPGIFCDFDINNSTDNIADYDALDRLVYMKDNSSDRSVGFALLSGEPRNLRAIHNPSVIWNNNFTDNTIYDLLTSTSNVNGLSPSDYSALMSFGPASIDTDSSATFTVAMLYSTSGLSGLQASLALAKAYIEPPSGFVVGDANGDGTVNVADAVYEINYVFKGGPPPDPYEAGDANCDGNVNVADAVYTINYVFKGGPVPSCP